MEAAMFKRILAATDVYLGYDRLDTVAQTLAVNQLYDKMWLYYNLFQPVMRLSEKISIREEGQPSRTQRCFDKAATPFDRLCTTRAISPEWKEQLAALRDQTNPRQLRREIYDLIDYIASLPGAVPGVTEDVRRTLVTDLISGQDAENLPALVAARKAKTLERRGHAPVTLSFEGTIPLR